MIRTSCTLSRGIVLYTLLVCAAKHGFVNALRPFYVITFNKVAHKHPTLTFQVDILVVCIDTAELGGSAAPSSSHCH